MAWTSPRTWNVGEKLTAALMNTHVRDNLLYLYGVITGTDAYKIPNEALSSGIDAGKITFGALDGALLSAGTVVGGSLAANLTLPATTYHAADGSYYTTKLSNNPIINFDPNDFFQYDRTNNQYMLYIGGVVVAQWDVNGKLTGNGIYDSGEFAIASGATVTLSPPFPTGQVGPRFVGGFWGTSGNTNQQITPMGTGASVVKFDSMISNVINVVNATGAATYARVFAIY